MKASVLLCFVFFYNFIFISSAYEYSLPENALNNPYNVFKLAPWSSMKEIKARYKELVMKYHPDKTKGETKEQFRIIQEAFESIKQQRKGSDEPNFRDIINSAFQSLLVNEGIYMTISFCIYLFSLFSYYVFIPAFAYIVTNNFFEEIIPHYFTSNLDLNVKSFFTSMLLSLFYIIYKKIKK